MVVLRHALRQRPARSVMYLSDKTSHAWLFRANARADGHDVVPFDKSALHMVPELVDRRAVLISDSIRPPQEAAFSIMITSPRRDRYKDFYHAQPCKLLIFPTFSWDEIQAMRDTCYADVTMDDVRARYAVAGGIPRQVFSFTVSELRDQVRDELSKFDTKAMVQAMESPIIESETSESHLLHMVPKGLAPSLAAHPPRLPPSSLVFYEPGCQDFASKFVAAEVFKKVGLDFSSLGFQPPSSDVTAGI